MTYELDRTGPHEPAPTGGDDPIAGPGWGVRASCAAIVILCGLHGAAIWLAMGGLAGIDGELPPLQADHGMHFHQGLITRQFLARTGIAAGYDPSFMSGYAMSVVSDPSSTLSDLTMLALPGRPALAYKLHVLACASAVPWLIALAALSWRARPEAVAFAVLLFLVYFWTDFPASLVGFGMLNYLVSVPLGLLAVSGLTAYLDRGGFGRWAWAMAACSAVFLSHPTSPLLVGPAGLLAYAVAAIRAPRRGKVFPFSRHVGLWAMAPMILAINAFWLIPGFSLAATKGTIRPFFAHPEPVSLRLGQILWKESPSEPILLGLALIGLVSLVRRGAATTVAALGGFLAAGFAWGYLAGAFRSLDQFQPGRHTYACYAAASIAAGFGLAEILARLRSPASRRLDLWTAPLLIMILIRVFGPALVDSVQRRFLGAIPFVSSEAPPGIVAMVELVRQNVKPGERLLYENPGPIPGGNQVDPHQGWNASVLLPLLAGVEVPGGPYPYTTGVTNFTQFGEGKLFEMEGWDRGHFTRYARLYRPSAIVCWSRKTRQFCLANPDLIEVIDDGSKFLVGRVLGFEGAAIQGSAEVEASPGRLVVRNAKAGPDGLVVLRYHAAPHLRASPTTSIEPIRLEKDPVPFIGLRPTTTDPITIELVPPPRSWLGL